MNPDGFFIPPYAAALRFIGIFRHGTHGKKYLVSRHPAKYSKGVSRDWNAGARLCLKIKIPMKQIFLLLTMI